MSAANKNIVITPYISGLAAELPKIDFTGGGTAVNTIRVEVADDTATLKFTGNASRVNGTILSIIDSPNRGISIGGDTILNASNILEVIGAAEVTGNFKVGGNFTVTGTFFDAELTGTPTAPTAESAATNTEQLATTAFTQNAINAAKNSPIFAGIPTAPTASNGSNSQQIATTAFVQTIVDAAGGYTHPADGTLVGNSVSDIYLTNFEDILIGAEVLSDIDVNSLGHVTSISTRTMTKGDLGLGNADNTSDVDKPVSTAQQEALDLKGSLSATQTWTGVNTFANNVSVGQAGVANTLTMANPGVGNTSTINFAKNSDTASIRVTEVASDQTEFQFYMSDNPSSSVDKFNWYMSSYRGPQYHWKPLEFAAYATTINSRLTTFNGDLNIGNIPYISTAGIAGSILESKTGTVAMTPDISGFSGTSPQGIYIELTTDGTTFNAWNKIGAAAQVIYLTDEPITGTPQLITAGIYITLSGTGGIAGDNWTFGVWPQGRVSIDNNVTLSNNGLLTVGSQGITTTGNIVVSGTVDGRDVATDGTNQDDHIASTLNPHSVTKAQVGLGSADNTSDADKPVSTAQQTALDLKLNSADLTKTAIDALNVDADTLDGIDGARHVYGDNGYATTNGRTDLDTLSKTGSYWASSATMKPSLNNGTVQHINHDGGMLFASQLFISHDGTLETYVRSKDNGVYRAWQTFWTNDNDGSGSGMDADLLDGQHGAYYTDYTDTAVANLIATAPATLDTLNELAAALGDDPNFATTIANSLALKAPLADPTFTGTVSGITKAMVGLGSVDDTSDVDKPISTATQTALDGKVDNANRYRSYYTTSASNSEFSRVVSPSLGRGLLSTDTGAIYRVSLDITSTGTNTGSSFVLENVDGLGWKIIETLVTSKSSNSPYIVIFSGAPFIRTGHATPYSVAVFVEEYRTGHDGLNKGILGADASFGAVSEVPYFIDSANNTQRIHTDTNFTSGTASTNWAAGNHTHTFDSLTSKTSGTGNYSTSGNLASGRGSGGVALTINDGYGNANLTFNHENGVPEQAGNAGRIEVNTDSTTGALMNFELKSGVTTAAIQTTTVMTLTEGNADVTGNISLSGTVDGRDVAADGTAQDNHIASTANPHSVTKAQVGLGSVDNTSDTAKPVSTAQQTALGLKLNLTGGALTGATTITVAGTSELMKIKNTGGDEAYYVVQSPNSSATALRVGIDLTGTKTSKTIIETEATWDSTYITERDIYYRWDVDGTNKYDNRIYHEGNFVSGTNYAPAHTHPYLSDAGGTLDGGLNTTVNILCDDLGQATLNVMGGTAQGTGRVYVGQSATHGGGIEYNGDNNPVTTGAGSDMITLFRRSGSVDAWTARNSYANNNWEFAGDITLAGTVDGRDVATDGTNQDNHIADTDNPHSVTKSQVGLSNVDNTSDADKPVSTDQQTALDLKLDTTGFTKVAIDALNVDADTLDGLDSSAFLRSDANDTITSVITKTYGSDPWSFGEAIYRPLSILTYADAGNIGTTGSAYTDVYGEADLAAIDLFETFSYAAAWQAVESHGGRLPTLAELWDGVGSGSGQSYDSELLWTCTRAGPHHVFVGLGALDQSGKVFGTDYKIVDINDVLEVYSTRAFFDVSRDGRPLHYSHDGQIHTTSINVTGTVDGRDVATDGTNQDNHIADTDNPHSVTKAQVGLSNVDNTSDAAKPVSTAQQTALDLKLNLTGGTLTGAVKIQGVGANTAVAADELYVSGYGLLGNRGKLYITNSNVAGVQIGIGAVHNQTAVAEFNSAGVDVTGNISLTGTVDGRDVATDGTNQDNHIASTANPHSVTKSQVGLSNVDNTSDVNKPISTATQTALDGKVDDAQVLTDVPAGALFTDTNTWRPIDDVPVNGVTTESISSNWAFDHTASSTAHPRDTRSQIAGSYQPAGSYAAAVHNHVASDITDFDTEVANNSAVALNTAKNTNVTTNLGYNTAASTGTVTSSDGTNATIPAATTTLAGLMTGADKLAHNNHLASTSNPHSVTKSQVGLSNVDNTSDVNKPVSTAQQTALDFKFDASGFTKIAIDALNVDADTLDGQDGNYNTVYTDTAISNLVASSPATLDTLNELAAALGDDPNFATTVTNSIATKLPLAGGTLTGDLNVASGSAGGIHFHNGTGARMTSVTAADIVMMGATQVRFSDSASWDWNSWAGISYINAGKTLYIGGPAGSRLTSNASPVAIDVNMDLPSSGVTKLVVNLLESSVATGTAPLTVASTTAVTNLNADLLDGYHASTLPVSTATQTALDGKVDDAQVLTNVPAGALFTDTTYTSSDFTHDDLSGVAANEHIDWTIDQGATNIHANNYTHSHAYVTSLTGTTNEVEVSASTGSVTVGLPNDVTITGTLSAAAKSFLIPHPSKEGKKLRHGSLEGPENGVYIRGRLLGNDKIELPDFWEGLVDFDTITVQLTTKHNSANVKVGNINKESVGVIRSLWSKMFGKKIDCYYTVYAERNDIAKLIVEE